MRLWSLATNWAGACSPLAKVTKIEAGCCTKLNALEMIQPSGEITRPVVGPLASKV